MMGTIDWRNSRLSGFLIELFPMHTGVRRTASGLRESLTRTPRSMRKGHRSFHSDYLKGAILHVHTLYIIEAALVPMLILQCESRPTPHVPRGHVTTNLQTASLLYQCPVALRQGKSVASEGTIVGRRTEVYQVGLLS